MTTKKLKFSNAADVVKYLENKGYGAGDSNTNLYVYDTDYYEYEGEYYGDEFSVTIKVITEFEIQYKENRELLFVVVGRWPEKDVIVKDLFPYEERDDEDDIVWEKGNIRDEMADCEDVCYGGEEYTFELGEVEDFCFFEREPGYLRKHHR